MALTTRRDTDQFVLLACDGVWDVMGSAEAVTFLASCLERAPQGSPARPSAAAKAEAEAEAQRLLGGVVERLLDECLRRGSMDNISAVLVILDPALRVRPHRCLQAPSAYRPRGAV